jgi:hypothetical protein
MRELFLGIIPLAIGFYFLFRYAQSWPLWSAWRGLFDD